MAVISKIVGLSKLAQLRHAAVINANDKDYDCFSGEDTSEYILNTAIC